MVPRAGFEIVEVNRGGKITYHGPGQLVGYPIVAVDDVVEYVRTLERGLVEALAAHGIQARARPQDGPDYTGVWVQERKIASIGVHVARGVTTHGFAVNVDNDLAPFGWVVACGLPDVTMTSIAAEAARASEDELMRCFRRRTAFGVAEALGRRQRIVSLERLEQALGRPRSSEPRAVGGAARPAGGQAGRRAGGQAPAGASRAVRRRRRVPISSGR